MRSVHDCGQKAVGTGSTLGYERRERCKSITSMSEAAAHRGRIGWNVKENS
jgi:hypothetical protein